MRNLSPSERASVRATLTSETLISIREAATILDTREPIVMRWIIRGRGGKRLEGFKDKISGEWYTSRAACLRFEGMG